MKKSNIKMIKYLFPVLAILLSMYVVGCAKEDNGLTPYAGSPAMSDITIETGVFKPRITWLGGYASIVGVNKGTKAALDSSLIWLIHSSGNSIHYPVTFGSLPSGAEDLTTQFGGKKADSLSEDNSYTFWVLKEDVWNQISGMKGKYLKFDSTLSSTFTVTGDTIFLSSQSYVEQAKNQDVYINIQNVSTFGQLGQISLEIKNSSRPAITWKIIQAGISDTLISAIGIVEGNQYDPAKIVWEVYSEHQDSGKTFYGKKNVIQSPLVAGQSIAGTHVFTEYPAEGLQRGKGYYIWIAAKDWNGVDRLRFAQSYAYATFSVR